MPVKKKKRVSVSFRMNDVLINYVHVIKPGEDLDGNLKYMLFATFPEDHPQIDALLEAIETVAEANGLDIDDDNFKHPLRSAKGSNDFRYYLPSKQLELGFLGLNCKAPYNEDRENDGQPVLVDAKRNFISSSADIYSGCTANISVNLYSFSESSEGVAVGLRGVQVIEKGERLDGVISDPDELFDEVEGFTSSRGFEQGSEVEDKESEVTTPKRKRGRPKADKAESEVTTSTTKRKRGRPTKTQSEEIEEESTTPARRTRKTQTKKSTGRRSASEEIPEIFDEEDLI